MSRKGLHAVLSLAAALVVIVAISAAFLRENDSEAGAAVASMPAAESSSRNALAHELPTRPTVPGAQPATARLLGNSPAPLEFIRSLAKRAFEGDAEAQYLIARESIRCDSTLSLVRKERDPAAALWKVMGTWPEGLKAWTFAEFQRCAALLSGDPFDGLPPRDGGYPYGYWMRRALESGHPVAVVDHEVPQLLVAKDTDSREKIAAALLSGDPDAQLMLGNSLLNQVDERMRIVGAAWMMVACSEGGDCGAGSAIVPLRMCIAVAEPECPDGTDVQTYLSATMNPTAYAKAYALREEFATHLREGNASAIAAQLNFRPADTSVK